MADEVKIKFTKKMKLSRKDTLRFELIDGRVIDVAPPTIEAVRLCLMLDPEPEVVESPSATLLRMADQLRALLGEQAEIVETLTPNEARVMMQALMAHLHGMDPQSMVDLMRVIEELAKKKSVAGDEAPMMRSTESTA